MIIIELIISILIFASYLATSIMLLNTAKKSPIIEMKLLTVASFISLLFFAGMVLTALLNTPHTLNPLTETIFRSGFVFAQLCIFIISIAFILPDFQYRYSSIAVISLITAANTISVMINVTTLTLRVTEYIKLNFNFLGFILFSISTILIAYSALQRLIKDSKIAKAKGVAVIPTRSALIMSLIMISFLVLILLDNMLPLHIPGFSYFIPLLVGGLYLNYLIKKDPAIFFLTPASLEAVIIIDHHSDLVIFSRAFIAKDDDYGMQDWQLVGGFFSALNISLRVAIKSEKGIDQISFGDKNIIMARGHEVTCVLIVTEKNFITQAISQYLVKQFEQLYEEKLQLKPFKSAVFDDFELVVASIRRYLPL
jgi:hypothetical protein